MLFKRPPNLRCTDMCKYIDANVANIATPGEHPDIENTVYNYLWLLIKALAIKKHMFQKFEDYDGYAFYSATRIFTALRNNYNNQGKTIKGKLIRPIKNTLDYTKALMHPMKLEYQKETFNVIISEEMASKKFDSALFAERLKYQAQSSQNGIMYSFLRDTLDTAPLLIDKILEKSPFTKDSEEYHNLKISILLNALRGLKQKQKLDWDPITVILWKLPRSLTNYVKVLLREFYTELKTELIECIESETLPDEILEKIIVAEKPVGDEDYEI